MAENLIELKHISRQFDDGFVVVEDLNLEIAKGEFVTFLGPSGCGKTTTLRMIAGFDLPSKGQILLNGEDITKLPPNERPINTVFQRYALFPHLNVYDNIAFGLKLKGMDKALIHEKVKNALDVVDLEGFEKRKITTLSGGQQQRVAIARAIVNEPQILLLDEPLGALDLKMRKEMQLELKSMHEKLGITFIYVTHDQEEALTMSDKVVVMSDGEILQIGTPEEIYNEPNTVFVADFIGESNIYNGTMVAKKTVNFLNTSFPCLDDLKVNSKVDVIVRPEDVIMTEKDAGMFNGRVESVIFKGMHYEIVVISDESEIVIQSTKSAKIGEEIGMIIEPDGIHVIQAETDINIFEGVLAADSMVEFADGSFECDLTKVFTDASYNEDGELVDADGVAIDYIGKEVVVNVDPSAPVMSDNPDEGGTQGNIISLIYKGDHYHYIVRTVSEEDIHLHDEYLWNEGDFVSVIIDKKNINIKLKDA